MECLRRLFSPAAAHTWACWATKAPPGSGTSSCQGMGAPQHSSGAAVCAECGGRHEAPRSAALLSSPDWWRGAAPSRARLSLQPATFDGGRPSERDTGASTHSPLRTSAGERKRGGFLSCLALEGGVRLASSLEVAADAHRSGAVDASVNVRAGLAVLRNGLTDLGTSLSNAMMACSCVWAAVTAFKDRR